MLTFSVTKHIPHHGGSGLNPTNCIYSFEPRTEVYCFRLNFIMYPNWSDCITPFFVFFFFLYIFQICLLNEKLNYYAKEHPDWFLV